MADLRIADAPEIDESEVQGGLKIPTGGFGNKAINMTTVANWVVKDKDLPSKGYVDNAVAQGNQGLAGHVSNKNNPHEVTKEQVGLGNVDNTADADKPVSNATGAALNLKADKSQLQGLATTTQLDLKADKSTTYTKTEVDGVVDDLYQSLEDNFVANGAALPYDPQVTYNDLAIVNDNGTLRIVEDGNLNLAIKADSVQVGDSTLDVFVEKLTKTYSNTNEMLVDESLKDGDIVSTKGYYNSFDDGGATYLISNISTNYSLQLSNGLHAVFRDVFDIRKFGIKDDENLDQKANLERMLAYADDREYEIDFHNFKILNPKTHYRTTTRGSVLRGLVFRKLHKLKNLQISNNKNEVLEQGVIPIIFAANNPDFLSKCVLENITLDPYVENINVISGEHDGFMHGIYFDKTSGSFQNANNISLEFNNVNFKTSSQSYNISASAELFHSISFNGGGGDHLMLYSFLLAKDIYVDGTKTNYRDDLVIAGRSTGNSLIHIEPENHNGEPINLNNCILKNVYTSVQSDALKRGSALRLHLIANSGLISFNKILINNVDNAYISFYGGENRRIEVNHAQIDNSENSILHVHGKVRKVIYNNTDVKSFPADGAFVLNGGEREYVEINNCKIIDAISAIGQAALLCKELVCNNIKVFDENYGLMRQGTTPTKIEINGVELLNDSARLIETAIETQEKTILVRDLKIPKTLTSDSYGNILFLRNDKIDCDVNGVFCGRSEVTGLFLSGTANDVSLRNSKSKSRFSLTSSGFTTYVEDSVLPKVQGSKVWDFANLVPDQTRETNVTAIGAQIGMNMVASHTQPLLGTTLRAEVTAENTVTVYHHNPTTTDVNVESGTLTVKTI